MANGDFPNLDHIDNLVGYPEAGWEERTRRLLGPLGNMRPPRLWRLTETPALGNWSGPGPQPAANRNRVIDEYGGDRRGWVEDPVKNLWERMAESEARFGSPHAGLFPLIGRRVWTPDGAGVLLTVFGDGCEIRPDPKAGVVRVRTEDVRPIQ